jgi:hypothetical protein
MAAISERRLFLLFFDNMTAILERRLLFLDNMSKNSETQNSCHIV